MTEAVESPATIDQRPLISVVIACFNAVGTIEAAIRSVLDQGRNDVELVVIDGRSTDGTRAIVERYADHLAHWVSEPDTGIYNAWNKGVKAARGQYIAFLGADDSYLPGAFDAYAWAVGANPGARYLSSRVLYSDGAKARVIGSAWDWSRFRRHMNVAHVGSLHARTLYDDVGLYDEGFRITGDYELLLRAGPKLVTAFVPDITVSMADGGVSSGHSTAVFDESMRAKALHSGLSRWALRRDRWRAVTSWTLRRLFRR